MPRKGWWLRLLFGLLLALLEMFGVCYAIVLWARHCYDDASWWSAGSVLLGVRLWRDRERLASRGRPTG